MQDTVGCLQRLVHWISVSAVTAAFLLRLSPLRWCEPAKACHVPWLVLSPFLARTFVLREGVRTCERSENEAQRCE